MSKKLLLSFSHIPHFGECGEKRAFLSIVSETIVVIQSEAKNLGIIILA